MVWACLEIPILAEGVEDFSLGVAWGLEVSAWGLVVAWVWPF